MEAEVRLLSRVKHENLVALVGFCEETGKNFINIYRLDLNKSILIVELIITMINLLDDFHAGPNAAKILVYEYVTNGSLLDYIIGN